MSTTIYSLVWRYNFLVDQMEVYFSFSIHPSRANTRSKIRQSRLIYQTRITLRRGHRGVVDSGTLTYMYCTPARQCLTSLRLNAFEVGDHAINQNLTPLLVNVVESNPLNNETFSVRMSAWSELDIGL